jgi:transposase
MKVRIGNSLDQKRETPWLKDSPIHPLQQTLKDLERAYGNFFAKRAAFPRFKKKGQAESFRFPDRQQIRLDQGNSRDVLEPTRAGLDFTTPSVMRAIRG